MRWIVCFLLTISLSCSAYAKDRILNLYTWSGEIPDQVIADFEKQSGIKVNFTSYENNETMYAKLRADSHHGYDLILPSSYFVDKMRRQDMLLPLDKNRLPNIKNIDPYFANAAYDPGLKFSIPHVWGTTNIFVNNKFYSAKKIQHWSNLWEKRFYNQLMLIDDMREAFSMALLSLGHPVNDEDPAHIREAYLKLKLLMPNVKVFSSETVISIIIDEDARAGMAWNGDIFKAWNENSHIQNILPKEGFVIWVDNLAIPKNAPHKAAAYQFINFVLSAEVGKKIALKTGFPTANLAAKKLLPKNIQSNPTIYPSKKVLKRGQFQTDLSSEALGLYEKYWALLKLGV